MLKSSFCNCSGAYMLIKGIKTVANTSAADVDVNNTDKKVIFRKCAPINDCIGETNKTQ